MGYVQHKYTRAYYLREDENGNPTEFGADGAELYKHADGPPREFDRRILDQINPKAARVLDLGCGRGEAAKYMKERGADHVIGVDFSQDAYDLARSLHERCGYDIELHCCDALEYVRALDRRQTPENFDIVLMLDFIEHVPRSELREILNTLRQHTGLKPSSRSTPRSSPSTTT